MLTLLRGWNPVGGGSQAVDNKTGTNLLFPPTATYAVTGMWSGTGVGLLVAHWQMNHGIGFGYQWEIPSAGEA